MLKVGQHVACIGDDFGARSDERVGVRYPVRGTVYTIRAVCPAVIHTVPTLLLEEIVNPVIRYKHKGVRLGALEKRFDADRFRPLVKLRVEDFMSVDAPLETEQA